MHGILTVSPGPSHGRSVSHEGQALLSPEPEVPGEGLSGFRFVPNRWHSIGTLAQLIVNEPLQSKRILRQISLASFSRTPFQSRRSGKRD